MKTITICLLCMLFSFFATGQNKQGGLVDELIVNQPKFTGVNQVIKLYNGSSENISQYIADNLELPESAKYAEGTEIIQFVVAPTGQLHDFNVINSIHPDLDLEVIRVLEMTNGMWIPGMSDGQPVAMEKEISISFSNSYNGSNTSAVFDDFKENAEKSFVNGTEKLFVNNNARQALRQFNEGIKYLPNDAALLYMRGMARYEIGDITGARQDWSKLKASGEIHNLELLTENYNYLKGYDEFMKLANE